MSVPGVKWCIPTSHQTTLISLFWLSLLSSSYDFQFSFRQSIHQITSPEIGEMHFLSLQIVYGTIKSCLLFRLDFFIICLTETIASIEPFPGINLYLFPQLLYKNLFHNFHPVFQQFHNSVAAATYTIIFFLMKR